MTSYRLSGPARSVAALAVATVVLAGCGIRIGGPPAPIPSPDEIQTWRQDAAIAVERVIHAAEGEQGGAEGDVVGDLVEASTEYLDDLGGVWLPPPRDEDPSPISPAHDQVRDLAAALEESSTQILSLARSGPDDSAAALVSMWLTWHTAAVLLADERGTACPQPCGSGIVPPTLYEEATSGELTSGEEALREAVAPQSPDLIGVYDALGYIEEVRAARAPADSRDDIAARARELRHLADLLAGESAGTDVDTRLSAYEINLDDLEGSVQKYATAAVEQWLTLVPRLPPGAQTPALEGLWHAYSSAEASLEVELWPGLGQ